MDNNTPCVMDKFIWVYILVISLMSMGTGFLVARLLDRVGG
jgi:hypothetical protein